MKAMHLMVLLIGILAWAECAPYHQQEVELYHQLGNPDDETEQFQQAQEHEDILDSLQQQAQSEDLHQFQQNHIPEDLSGHLEDFRQSAQKLQQPQELNDYSHLLQAENIERFPEPHVQLQEAQPESDDIQQFQPEEFNQHQQGPLPDALRSGRIEKMVQDDEQEPQNQDSFLGEYDQQSHSEDLNQYGQQQENIQNMGRLTDDTQQIQDHDSFIDDTQQHSQVEDLTQFQQGILPHGQQSGRLEDLNQEAETLQHTQEKQIEDLSEYPEQAGQIRVHEEEPSMDETQQIQDHDSFIDDTQQHSQVEDLTQFQQGILSHGQQSGRLEDLNQEAETLQHTQEKQIEDLSEYPEQVGQIRVQEEEPSVDETQQIQDHDSFIDDTQQHSQVEDLTQFQQGILSHGQQSGRLEDFNQEAETLQHTQEKQIEDLSEYPEQVGQIRVQEEEPSVDETQQIQDHDSFTDDTQQQSQVEDLTQFQQGILSHGQQSGRLEDLNQEAETLQHTQEKQIEDLYIDQDAGQIRQDAHGQSNAEFFDGSEQETQHEDLLSQIHVEPKIPALQISQVRHEQQPYSYNAQNLAAEAESQERGRSYNNHEDHAPADNDGGLHQQPLDYFSKYELSDLNSEHHLTTKPAPGFWKRLGSKIESAYEKAKDKSRKIIHDIKESVG